MASVEADPRTGGKTYRVQYRKPDGKLTSKGGFKRKRDAQAFAEDIENAKRQGSYTAPADARATIGELGADWIVARKAALKPSTYHSEESAWRVHVEPRWGAHKVGSIRHTHVMAWIAELSADKSPTTVKRAHGVLAAILDGAVRDRRILENPARNIKTPKKVRPPKPYLSHRQVERLAQASRYPDVIRFVSYTGLRWGEATALRIRNVDRKKRTVTVEENAVVVNGHVQVGTPKAGGSRTVPYPAFLDEAIAKAAKGRAADAILWEAEHGGYLSSGNTVNGWFAAAVKRVQREDQRLVAEARKKGQDEPPILPKVTPHALRHTAASLAVSAGAHVKAVQRMLGHQSAAMTLDVYSDLFDEDLSEVAEALDRRRAASLAAAPVASSAAEDIVSESDD